MCDIAKFCSVDWILEISGLVRDALGRHQTAYAYVLGFVGVLCFAATLPLTSIALADFSPTFITMIRAVIAGGGGLYLAYLQSVKPTNTS